MRQCSEIFENLGMNPNPCPADIDLIEQFLLARNRVQHPEEITTLRVSHNKNDIKKYPKPFFARESEYEFFSDKDDSSWLIPPAVTVTSEMVLEAIKQVDLFCSWLDSEYWKCKKS